MASRAACASAGALQLLLGPLPLRRRLPPRSDPARAACLRLHSRLATFLPGDLAAAAPTSGGFHWTAMAEICVMGAGPAGSTYAARMAQLGHDVCIVEAARFPRARLGESL